MQRSDFHFDLPEELIAQRPLAQRSASRLLQLSKRSGIADHQFKDLPDLLQAGDLLVFNDTRVIPARLKGKKLSGGKVEVLIERIRNPKQAIAQIRSSKSPKPGTILLLEDAFEVRVTGRLDDLFEVSVADENAWLDLLSLHGRVPLPPYIQRQAQPLDAERYQTVYAAKLGAVAAPTAGLHFDESLLQKIQDRGVESAFITLHVGAGTFQPVRVDNIEAHKMHAEFIEVTAAVCEQVNQTRQQGGRVIAVGTTAVRSLESASKKGRLQPFSGDSNIFIYPGYRFQCIDAMITNFHLPESTLLMLVCAYAGYQETMEAYRHAVDQRYRFFSYGDAMLLTP